MSIILECNNLIKRYGDNTAVNGVNLKLETGKIIGLFGPNGSGKTTLLKMVEKLTMPTSGSIMVDGMEPGKETKAIVSYLPDRMMFDEKIKVKDTIALYREFFEDFEEQTAREMLQKLKINESAVLETLSKGTKDKLQLILAMSRKAKLYVLDEPLSGVDPASVDYIIKTIISNYNEGATVIIATHLLADIEAVIDEVIFIKKGEIVLHKSVDEIREEEGKSVDSLFRGIFKYE